MSDDCLNIHWLCPLITVNSYGLNISTNLFPLILFLQGKIDVCSSTDLYSKVKGSSRQSRPKSFKNMYEQKERGGASSSAAAPPPKQRRKSSTEEKIKGGTERKKSEKKSSGKKKGRSSMLAASVTFAPRIFIYPTAAANISVF